MSSTKDSRLARGCQSLCVLIIGVLTFSMILSVQDMGFDLPLFMYIGWFIVLLCILIALGLIIGKCKPWTPHHSFDYFPL
ncbi:MAG: hypothetical protein JW779_10375 [Candidatus Thorarchaeota archaeon]|nr:hypothetical protein [Candidatus Thorarchaeota archaeon]